MDEHRVVGPQQLDEPIPVPPPRAVIGIGGCARDLPVLSRVLQELPGDTGVAIVFVSPLQTDAKPLTARALRKNTRMTVLDARDGLQIQSDHVYVVPAVRPLVYRQGAFARVSRKSAAADHPVDTLLSSLAQELQSSAIGVLLAGAGQDGDQGLLAIKTEGGLTLVEETEFQSAGPAVDVALPAKAIAAELVRMASHPYVDGSVDEHGETLDDIAPKLFALLRKSSGVDFSQYKPSTVRRRIVRRMLLQRTDTPRAYYQVLKQSPDALAALFQDLLISVTGLFRDPETYEALARRVLPGLLKALDPDQPVRIWVPGCSKGDEVYSIAITVLEAMKARNMTNAIQLFGTDINERALEEARAGIYPTSLVGEVSPELLRTYFQSVEGGYQIVKSIRDLCLFARQDLTKDPPFSRLDLISCRNVLIYLNPNQQYRILRIFHYALRPHGYLMLGTSESIGRASEFFSQIERTQRLFSRKSTPPPMPAQLFEPAAQVRARPDAPRPRVPQSGGGGTLAEMQREADRLTLARYGPPGVVVNEDFEVLQYRGRTGDYLEPPSGSVTNNLLKLAREGLLAELRAALRQSSQENIPIRREGVRVRTTAEWNTCNVEITPFYTPSNRERVFLVLFTQESWNQGQAPPYQANVESSEAELIRLRQELASTREYLNAINQEQEATLESLQAANEEIQSSNEELQSTNEELETTTEELQSMNEELNTVNEELHERNVELTQVNNDLTNLLSSVSIPVVILGADLRIRRFTPMSRQVLRVIPSDIGRPIGDLRPQIEIPELETRIREVLDNLVPQQLELQDREGRWYSVRIRPYRTSENRIDGAVLVFVDIDQLRRSLEDAQAARDLTRAVMDARRQPFAVIDGEFQVLEANERFLEGTNLSRDEVLMRQFFALDHGRWNRPELRARLEQLVQSHTRGGFDELVTWRDAEGTSQRVRIHSAATGQLFVLLFGAEEQVAPP
jgi:two-component system, chemotaxis family, CheB/CheR fusion protein